MFVKFLFYNKYLIKNEVFSFKTKKMLKKVVMYESKNLN